MTRRLELWVQLRELNEAGQFTAVEVLPAKDVRTGGVFQLRQVYRRLISVSRVEKGHSGEILLPLAGSVPSGPSGGALSARFGHHAPHRCLRPLCVHRRRQSPPGPSVQRRITMGEFLSNKNKTYIRFNIRKELFLLSF